MNLRTLRKAKGISQRKMAEMLGLNQSTYSHYEKGIREPRIAMLRKMADVLGVTIDELIK